MSEYDYVTKVIGIHYDAWLSSSKDDRMMLANLYPLPPFQVRCMTCITKGFGGHHKSCRCSNAFAQVCKHCKYVDGKCYCDPMQNTKAVASAPAARSQPSNVCN